MNKILLILLLISVLLNLKQCTDFISQYNDNQILEYELIDLESNLNSSKKEIQDLKKSKSENKSVKISNKNISKKINHVDNINITDSINTNIITDTLKAQ